MKEYISIDKIVQSISVTHKFDKPSLIFLNTSDISSGKIINKVYLPISKLKGQAKKTIKKNDILFSEIRPKNKRFAYVDFSETEDYVVSTKLMVLRNINPDIDNKYFYYFLTSNTMLQNLQNRAENRIGSFPQITFNLLKDYKIRKPDINEQVRIASILSNLDLKIDINNKINNELDNFAKTLYYYWFVQFNFNNNKNKPYKDNNGKMIWDDKIKKEIPYGWRTEKLSEWINLDKSGDWGKEEPEGVYLKKVTCIRGADLNGLNGLDELNPPVRYISEQNTSRILKSHDLIIEISGGSSTQSTGRLAFITDAMIKRFDNPLVCSNFCKPISLKNKKFLYNFAYCWNSLYENGVFFDYEGKTSGIKNLLLDSFVSSYYVVVPDEKIVNQFYDIMEDIQLKKQTNLAENEKLSELRDWLLPMLMNGQIVVK